MGPFPDETMVIGELSPDDSVRHIKGVLPVTAKTSDVALNTFYVPQEDAPKAALTSPIEQPSARASLGSSLQTRPSGVQFSCWGFSHIGGPSRPSLSA